MQQSCFTSKSLSNIFVGLLTLVLPAIHAAHVASEHDHGKLFRRENRGSTNELGVPQQISTIPAELESEHSRCAGSWKSDVFTPRLTTQEELEEPSHKELIGRFHEKPVMHRKQWEYVFLLKILDSLPPLQEAVGFAVGQEPTVSYLASKGVSVVATDLAPDAAHAAEWQATQQLMLTKDQINERHIATAAQMEKYVSQEFVDMNKVQDSNVWKQGGAFDLLWSICSVEHTGSIRNALNFMEKSLEMLKPGGTAVHTTEFNVVSTEKTIDHQGTVVFRKSDVDLFYNCAIKKGYTMKRPCFDVSNGPVDREYDIPPYSHDLHLRLQMDKFVATCVGLVVKKPSNFADNGFKCAHMFDQAGLL